MIRMVYPPRPRWLLAFPCLLTAAALGYLCGCGDQGSDPDQGSLLKQPGCNIAATPCGQANVCAERVCNGVGWTCSWLPSVQGFGWSRKGACEDDGDICTEELCLDGLCIHRPKTCEPSTNPCFENVCQGGPCGPRKIECNNLPAPVQAACGCAPTCESGTGDCDNNPSNGCETTLDQPDHCGQCNNVCPGAPHAVPACNRSTPDSPYRCDLTCTDSYQNCDGDMSNGCEVPVGVPNTCDASGIALESTDQDLPCGTPYCGSASTIGNDVFNFPGFYCVVCNNCHNFSNFNLSSWCNWSTGRFNYPSQDMDWCTTGTNDVKCPAK